MAPYHSERPKRTDPIRGLLIDIFTLSNYSEISKTSESPFLTLTASNLSH